MVGDGGGVSGTVQCSQQGECKVEDVTVEKMTLFLKHHCQVLGRNVDVWGFIVWGVVRSS